MEELVKPTGIEPEIWRGIGNLQSMTKEVSQKISGMELILLGGA
jgi:hypothetical protein